MCAVLFDGMLAVSVCVCVCVCVCVQARAYVCVYTLPPVGLFRLHKFCDIREYF